MRIKPTLNTILVTGIAAGTYSGMVAGQDTSPVSEPAASQGVLETVLVTAQRREERLVDVPISITALSSEELLRSGITSTQDLVRVTPGLEMVYNGGFMQPSLRGVSSQGSSAGDSSNVALYLDGVYMPSQPGQMMDLPDAEQVQVLKGPQGTLYGQNATGGAIIITTVSPSLEESGGRLSAGYGNYNDVNINGYYTTPLADALAVSVAVSSHDRDGFRDDLVYGGEDKGLRSSLVRGKLLFQPTDRIELTLSGYSAERKDSSPYSGLAYDNRSVGYLAAAALPPGYDVPEPDWDETSTSRKVDTDNSTWGSSLLAEFDLDFGTLSSTTSYTESDVAMAVDVDYSFFHMANVTVELEQEFFVQELNFVSEQFGNWQFSGGLFYMQGKEEYVPNTFTYAFNPGPAPAVSESEALLTPIQYTWGYIEKEIYAAYAEVTYDLAERWQLTVGGRYSEEKQDVASNWPDTRSSVVVDSPYNTASFSQFTPRATLTYAISDDANLYASYSEGFKSGYLSVAAAEEPPVEPEEITAYEVGYKGEVGDTLSLSAALFYYEYQDLQVARYEAPNYIYDNAAEASMTGGEFNATWQAIPGLTFMAGLSYLDASYDSFPGATAYRWSPLGGNVTVDFDASDSDLIRAPEYTGFINASYSVNTGLGEFGFFAAAYYNDGYNLELTGSIAQDSYTTVDAELSFTPAAFPRLRMALWGNNLTDEDVLQSLLETPLASGVSYGPPVTWGLRADLEL
ncbi:TonB-dependent receptor [Haliea sp. E17]|uniref:TonB-dependent receptor n=1 Tax=Haliea sp. E17 TaxID=3401576 RepID=UPI003AAA2A1C